MAQEEKKSQQVCWVGWRREREKASDCVILGKKVLGRICYVVSCWMRQLLRFYSNPTVTIHLKSVILAGKQVFFRRWSYEAKERANYSLQFSTKEKSKISIQ